MVSRLSSSDRQRCGVGSGGFGSHEVGGGWGRSRCCRAGQGLGEACGQGARVAQGALPDDDHTPAGGLEGGADRGIALDGAVELGQPPGGARAGRGGIAAARVAVPEAAVEEEGGAVARQDDIGS